MLPSCSASFLLVAADFAFVTMTCWIYHFKILVPLTGIEPVPLQREGENPYHWSGQGRPVVIEEPYPLFLQV